MEDTHTFVNRVAWEPENDKPGLKRAIDEIVTGPVDSVHIERMDNGEYWMSITKGTRQQIVIFHSRGKLYCRTEAD